jgi:hypothetical protein
MPLRSPCKHFGKSQPLIPQLFEAAMFTLAQSCAPQSIQDWCKTGISSFKTLIRNISNTLSTPCDILDETPVKVASRGLFGSETNNAQRGQQSLQSNFYELNYLQRRAGCHGNSRSR